MTRDERQKQADRDLHAVLSTPEGRRFIFRLAHVSLVMEGSYVSGPGGDRDTAYNEGRRAVAVSLLKECKRVSGDLYRRAWRENLDAEERDLLAEEKRLEDAKAADE